MSQAIGVRAVMVLASLLLAAGCGSRPEPAADARQAGGGRSQQDELFSADSTLARAVSSDKSGAAVGLGYDLQGRPAVGVAVPLVLVFQVGAQVQAFQAVITGMDGLALQGELQAGFEPVSPGQPYRHELTVIPGRTGVFYLTVVVSALNAGAEAPQERTFSIPFVVGDAAAESPSTPAAGAGEASGDSLPAGQGQAAAS